MLMLKCLVKLAKFVALPLLPLVELYKETAALAGVLGNAGIQSTMAGTMLGHYLRLAAPAKSWCKALGNLREEMQISAEEMPDVAKEALLAQKRFIWSWCQILIKR